MDYTIKGLTAQDDIRLKLNGGGSETVADTGYLGPAGLIFDGSNRAGGGNTLYVGINTPGFVASMTTDAAGDPQLQVNEGRASFHGSTTADLIEVDDDDLDAPPAGQSNTFDIDDSALEGTLDLVGNPFSPAPANDTFEITNTPSTGLTTDLTGGTGANVFDIVHGGVNQNITVAGGTGTNTLVLDRPQSSAAAPDSVTLAPLLGRVFSRRVAITGSATSITMSGVYIINVNMYGGTLDAGDLVQDGNFTIDVTGKLSPLDDPNHVIIEPPQGGLPDNLTVQANSLIQDTATGTNYSIAGLVAQDDVRIKLNGGGAETVNDLQTLGPYTLIFDGSARSGGGNTLNVPITTPSFSAIVATDAAGDPELQLSGGLVSFHGSSPADQINVIDNGPDGFGDKFYVNDDSALEGTLDLLGNQSPSGMVNDNFIVTNTANAHLLTELDGWHRAE